MALIEIFRNFLNKNIDLRYFQKLQKLKAFNTNTVIFFSFIIFSSILFFIAISSSQQKKLINEILKRGGTREGLRAKIFGGGSMNTGGEKVGQSNIAFAQTYLKTERIPILAEDVGGEHARKVYFQPETGNVTVKAIMSLGNDTLEQREKTYAESLQTQEKETDDIVLF